LRLAQHFVVWADGCGTSLGTWGKVDGLVDGGNLVELVRVASPDSELVRAWLNDNQFLFRSLDVTITLLDSVGSPVATWRLSNALPLKWSIEAFDAGASQVAQEILALKHEGVTPADPC
jgi:phage tail-like protein